MATKPGAVMDDQKPAETALAKTDDQRTPSVITTPKEYQSSLTRWQAQSYHVLSPAVTFSGLPPQHGMVAALVQINPNPDAGDVYQDPLYCKGDEVAIAKIGLSKIAQAAGMTIKTERTDPRTISNYWEVRATARFLGLDGTPQELDATVEYDLRDGSPRVRNWSDRQKQAARAHGLRGAEARAINAAIRQFGIKQKYTKAELAKPFVAIRVMFQPDMSDAETRRLVTERALQGTTSLYPSRAALPTVEPELLDVIGEGADEPRPVGSGTLAATSAGSSQAPATDEPPTPDAVRIVEVTSKSGEKNGRKWTRYVIVDSQGVEHSTFNSELANFAEKAKSTKLWVEITEEVDGQYRNLVEIARAGEQPSLLPDPASL